MKIHVKPIYGWGWSDDTGFIDVPTPFEAEVIHRGTRIFEGMVITENHHGVLCG